MRMPFSIAAAVIAAIGRGGRRIGRGVFRHGIFVVVVIVIVVTVIVATVAPKMREGVVFIKSAARRKRRRRRELDAGRLQSRHLRGQRMIGRHKGRETGSQTRRIHAERRKRRGRRRRTASVFGRGGGSRCRTAGIVELLQIRQLSGVRLRERIGAGREFGRGMIAVDAGWTPGTETR